MLGALVHGSWNHGVHLCIKTLILDFGTHGTCGWLYELVFDHQTLILGPFVRRFICGALVFSLRSLIWWLTSWNPNHGYLAFVDHVGLTIDLVINWNPIHWRLVLDYHAMHHQSSSVLFIHGNHSSSWPFDPHAYMITDPSDLWPCSTIHVMCILFGHS